MRAPVADATSGAARLELKPVEVIRTKRQEVRLPPDRRKIGIPQHLHGSKAGKGAQIELYGLHRARQIRHAQNGVGAMPPDVGQDLPIGWMEKLQGTESECWKELAQADEIFHPLQESRTVPSRGLPIHALVPVDRIHDDGPVQASGISRRE